MGPAMNTKHLTPDDWFVASTAWSFADPEVYPEVSDDNDEHGGVAVSACKLERLGTGESVEATPEEAAEIIKAKRVFWKL